MGNSKQCHMVVWLSTCTTHHRQSVSTSSFLKPTVTYCLTVGWEGAWGQKYSEERRITLNQKSAEGEKSQSLEWKEGIELETETHHQGKVDLHSQSNIGSVLESSVLGSMG